MVEISKIFSTSSQTSMPQHPMVTCVYYNFCFKNLIFVLEMIVLECFGENILINLQGLKLWLNNATFAQIIINIWFTPVFWYEIYIYEEKNYFTKF